MPVQHTKDLTVSISGRSPGVPVKLVVVSGNSLGVEAPLAREVVVGSDESCELVINDPTVSRRHARVSVVDGKIAVEDLDSKNGTFLGATRVRQAELLVGVQLTVGKTTLALQPRWQLREVPPSSAIRFGEVIGGSLAMRELFGILERVAPTGCTVLVEGESGTGKELVCRALHRASLRYLKPYDVLDCGSLPRGLAESELFGHRRGAFTGATEDRLGAFQRADGGTLCLDEIGELPHELQTRLLRVLESGEVRRVGGETTGTVDVRVLAATNRELDGEVRANRFRADLLFRLAVVRVRVPPLRDRPEDIPALVRHFLAGAIADEEPIEGENLERLCGYAWPGNVRELRNVLARACALAGAAPGHPVRFADLTLQLGPEGGPRTIGNAFPGIAAPLHFKEAKGRLLAAFEHAYVETLLARHQGNITRAAEAAGLSRKHLYDLIRRTVGEGLEED